MNQKITIEYIKDFVKEIAPDTILISSEYKNEKEQLQFKCSCGEYFTKTWTTIQSKKTCKCRKCARKDGWENKRHESTYKEDCRQEIESFGFEPLGEIKNRRDKILCKDKIGYKGYISISNIVLGKHFGIFSPMYNSENLIYNLNLFLSINGSKTVVKDYIAKKPSTSTILKCKCECGEYFEANLGNLTTQNQWRCPKCSNSKSNIEYLAEQEIKKYCEYKSQYRFEDCRNPLTNYSLPFDFYISDSCMIIEIDGIQHYKPSKFGNETDEEAEYKLKYRQYLDNIKNEYCRNHNIQLVRISYKAFKNNKYKQIIHDLFH